MSNLKKFLNIVQAITIIILLGIIFLMKSCESNPPHTPPPTEEKTKYDTIVNVDTLYVPKLVNRYISKTDTTYLFIQDSTKDAICEQYRQDVIEYYTTKVFIDEKISDSLNLTIIDTVYKNNIVNRGLKYNLKIPAPPAPETLYRDKVIPDKGFYGGFGTSVSLSKIDYLGAELMYKSSKPRIYGLGIGINSNFSPSISGRMYWKINK